MDIVVHGRTVAVVLVMGGSSSVRGEHMALGVAMVGRVTALSSSGRSSRRVAIVIITLSDYNGGGGSGPRRRRRRCGS